jgi:ketosteroid isomerase-like protein
MEANSVEVVARWAEALRRGDLGDELWDANLEIVNARGWPVETTYRGHDGLHRWWQDLAEAFSDFALEFDEMTAVDDETVLTTQRSVGHFRHTGIGLDGRWASVITVRAGRIVRAVGYLSRTEAEASIRSAMPPPGVEPGFTA